MERQGNNPLLQDKEQTNLRVDIPVRRRAQPGELLAEFKKLNPNKRKLAGLFRSATFADHPEKDPINTGTGFRMGDPIGNLVCGDELD